MSKLATKKIAPPTLYEIMLQEAAGKTPREVAKIMNRLAAGNIRPGETMTDGGLPGFKLENET